MGQLQRLMWKVAQLKKGNSLDQDILVDLNNTGLISVRLTD